jgi:DNA-binding NarL/FixJ family response regulator
LREAFEVVADAESGDAGVADTGIQTGSGTMDITMPVRNGIKALKEITPMIRCEDHYGSALGQQDYIREAIRQAPSTSLLYLQRRKRHIDHK